MALVQLSGMRVLVTGGTSGVGRALAHSLSSRGADVMTCGRSSADAVRAICADLSVPGEAARVASVTAERLGGLDVVIANAGVQFPTPIVDRFDTEVLGHARQEIEVNLASVVELSAAAWPYLAASANASFVAVTSGLAYAPKRSAPVYCATKAGVHVFLEALRYQAIASTPHVRVQEIVLPLVDSAMTAGREGPSKKITADQAAAAIMRGIERGTDVVPVGASRMLLALLRISPSAAKRILRDG